MFFFLANANLTVSLDSSGGAITSNGGSAAWMQHGISGLVGRPAGEVWKPVVATFIAGDTINYNGIVMTVLPIRVG
jgi:hypothetical protein